MLKHVKSTIRQQHHKRGTVTMKIFLSLCILGLFAFSLSPVMAQSDFEEAPCPVPLPEGVIEGEHVICGYVTVPEVHADPEGPTIRLAIAVIKSTSQNPAPDPTIFVDGGPGQSTMPLLPFLLGELGQPVFAQRDLIIVEQRGNYFSEPDLLCEEVFATLGAPPETRQAQVLDAYQTCQERLISEGVNLSAFNSLENAADFPMIVEALGYDAYNIYGVSYGTQVAQHIMREHPEGIRSVTLNAVMTLDNNVNVDIPASAQRNFDLFFATCQADAACAEAYPDLENTFLELVAALNENPAQIEVQIDGEAVSRSLSGDDVIRALSEVFYPETIPQMPQIILDMANGDYSWMAARLSAETEGITAALGMMYSVICSEDADFTMDDLLRETPIEGAMAAGRPQEMLAVCEFWEVDALGERADEAPVSDIPTLLMTGEFDTITPPAYLDWVAQNLSNVHTFVFPGEGHGGIDACRLQVMLDFIDDPGQAPDAACIADMGVVFELPGADGSITLDDIGITSVVPADWTQAMPGAFVRGASADDSTLLMFARVASDDADGAVAGFFSEKGLDAPNKFNEVAFDEVSWTLYELSSDEMQVIVAATVAGENTYLMMLQASPDEIPGLLGSVLQPALESFSVAE